MAGATTTSTVQTGTAGDDRLNGGSGNDTLLGLAGDDRLNGGSGDDALFGGAGNDDLKGDSGDDRLDGGSGNDQVEGGSGNDRLVYVAAENRGSVDSYDGGAHTDTLQLVLTREEWTAPALQAEIARYLQLLADGQSPSFVFASLGLSVSGVERLEVTVDGVALDPRNETVTLRDDAITVSEDAANRAVNLLANDQVPDLIKSLTHTQAAHGAVAATVSLTDPAGAPEALFAYTPDATHWQHLALGETATDAFTYTVTDADGDTRTASVTVTIEGRNDAPVVLAAGTDANGAVTEGSGAGRLTDAGSVAFQDLDLSDGHTVSAVVTSVAASAGAPAVPAGGFGALSASVAETAGDADDKGRIDWTFSVDDAAVQALAAGETVTQTYAVTVRDPHGATAVQTVTVVIAGTNDGPVIGAADLAGAVTERLEGVAGETAGDLTDTGLIAFGDLDLSNTHTVSAVLASATDSAAGGAAARGVFTPTVVNATTGDGAGEVRWTYAVAAGALDDLAEGQSLTQVYTVTITDSSGASVSRDVSVILTGSNDAPTITSAVQAGAISEMTDLAPGENATTHTRAGAITFADVDANDVHRASFAPVADGYLGAFSLTPVDQAGHSVSWSFSVGDGALDFLQAGERRVQSYVVTVDDGHGCAAQQTVTLTLTGTDDAPVVTSAVQTGLVTEIADAAPGELTATHTRTGVVTFADVDLADTHSAAVAAMGGGYLGAFSLAAVDQAGDSVGWSFSVGDGALDFLQAGERRVQSYVVSVDDGHGGKAEQTVTLTLIGTNDAPVVTSAAQAGAIVEIGDNAAGERTAAHTRTGAVTFADADLGDAHAVSFAPTGSGYLGAFSLESSTATGGGVGWSFTVGDGALEALQSGETRVQSYVVTVDDGHGGAARQTVTLTLTGSNDAPIVTSAVQAGAITEIADNAAGERTAVHARAGAVTFTDADTLDAHTASVTAQGSNYLGSFTLAALDQAADSVGWNFTVADGALDFLQAGETRVQTYAVRVSDGHGGAAEQVVSITLTGTNDAPVITANAVAAPPSGINQVVSAPDNYTHDRAQNLDGLFAVTADPIVGYSATVPHVTITGVGESNHWFAAGGIMTGTPSQ